MHSCPVKSPEDRDRPGVRRECQSTAVWWTRPNGEGIRREHVQGSAHYAVSRTSALSSYLGTSFVTDMFSECKTKCMRQPDETHIAAGMADGTLSVRRRQPKATESAAYEKALSVAQAGAYDFLLTGVLPKIGQGSTKGKGKAKPEGDVEEYKVEARRKNRLRHYDRYLKAFKYSAALDAVLKKVGLCRILRSLDWPLTNCADCAAVDFIFFDSGAHS